MVQTCAVPGCKSHSRRTENIHFYQFPSEEKSPELRKQWLEKIGRKNPDGTIWEAKYFHKVCSKHFKDSKPTLESPLPELDLDLSEDNVQTIRRGRPPRSHMSPVPGSSSKSSCGTPKSTPTSDAEMTKETPKETDSASLKTDTNEDSNSSTQSHLTRSGKSNTEKSPSSDVTPRISGRKRKKRVMPDSISDEEVLDEEPETYVIWRARSAFLTPKSEAAEGDQSSGGGVMKGRMMRPRRMPSAPKSPSVEEKELPLLEPGKKKRLIVKNDDGDEEEEKDAFCWICHKEGTDLGCELCPRGFHLRCLDINQACPAWVCPECEKVMRAECVDTRSPAMSLLTIDQLCVILRFCCVQMRIAGSEVFAQPVNPVELPLYADFIANPIDFSTLEKNIKRRMYGSTEAFLADVKWLLHNSIVFNGSNNKLTSVARAIQRICKQEISDIEGCPDCYSNAWIKQDRNWFIKPCRIPHTLVWAKLKGYPFWPGKAVVEDAGQTDIRFFGAHDRAWVPTSNVFLLSREPPVEMKNRRIGLEEAMDELNEHIEKLRDKFGSFKYALPNVPYDPNSAYNQFGRVAAGQLKPAVKKELGLRKQGEATEAGSARKISVSESVSAASEVSSNPDTIVDRAETPMEDSKLEILQTPTESPRTPSKLPRDRSFGERTTPLKDSQEPEVDLSAWQKADSQGVFEVSDEALGPDIINLQRKKVNEDPVIRNRSSPMTKSIVDRLQEKIREAEMELARSKALSEEPEEEEPHSTTTTTVDRSSSPTQAPASEADSISKTPEKYAKPAESSQEQMSSILPEKDEMCEDVKIADVDTLSASGTPKKNPLLANLVESCKAQLGITNEEDLPQKEETTSPSEEVDEEDATVESRSISPETASSSKSVDDDEEEEEEEDDEEGEYSDNEEDDDEDGDDEEGEEEEEEAENEEKVTETEDAFGVKPSKEKSETSVHHNTSVNKDDHEGKINVSKQLEAKSETLEKSDSESKAREEDKENKITLSRSASDEPLELNTETKEETKETDIANDENIRKQVAIVEKPSPLDPGPTEDGRSVDADVKSPESFTRSSSPDKPFPSRLFEELSKPWPVKAANSDLTALDIKIPLLDEAPQSPQVSSLEAALLAPRIQPEASPNRHGLKHLQKPSEKDVPPMKKLKLDDEADEKEVAPQAEVKNGQVTDEVENNLEDVEMTDTEKPKSQTIRGDESDGELQQSSIQGAIMQPEDCVFNVEKYVDKAMQGVRSVFHNMFDDFISSDMGHKTTRHLKAELLRSKWHYDQALVEQQHNTDLMMAEMRMVLEHEQNVRVKKLIRLHEEEREKAIDEVKRKQWCANCRKEAMFYCCWNTSYCDYPCQQKHWPKHMSQCTQTNGMPSGGKTDSGQQQQPLQLIGVDAQQAKATDASRQDNRGSKHSDIRGVPINVSAGVQYLPSQSIAGNSVKAGVTKALKVPVQYLASPLGSGAASSPVALQQIIASQGTTTTSATGPIMYQFLPQSNIRIINPHSTTPITAAPTFNMAAGQTKSASP